MDSIIDLKEDYKIQNNLLATIIKQKEVYTNVDNIYSRYTAIQKILEDKLETINFKISVLSTPNTYSEYGDDDEILNNEESSNNEESFVEVIDAKI
jgi:hypothetical protein